MFVFLILFSNFFVEEEESDHGIAINRTILNQAYEIILQNSPNGVSVMELKKLMNIDFYMSRMILRLLERRGFVNGRKVDEFRQHTMRSVKVLYMIKYFFLIIIIFF